MKKGVFIAVLFATVMLTLTGVSYSWQGRMSGMANPYGLTPDESDFLIHPALIANGNGFKFYSNFDYTYTGISEWDMDIDVTSGQWESFDSSGDRQEYSALLGPVFSAGPGRLGIFFSYDGKQQDIDGDADYRPSSSTDASTSADYDLSSDMDDFSLRFIYGLPVKAYCINVGGEASISYREEDQKNKWVNNDGTSLINLPMATSAFWMESNMFWFQIPYDSDYWDAQFKGSIDGQICPGGIDPIDVTLSVGGGFIFAGDNEYNYEGWDAGAKSYADLDGDVDGWNIGADLWVRVPVSNDFTLVPLVARVEYSEKTRDGKGELSDPDGFFMGFVADGTDIKYEHEEERFLVEVGGGMDTKLSDSSQIAAGIFYTYFNNSDTGTFDVSSPGYRGVYDDSAPNYSEHRISFKMGWETSLSSSAALRAGFGTFYGFVYKDFDFDFSDNAGNSQKDVASLDGYQWGITASFGGTLKLQSVTLEPYINAGYKDLDLDGDEHTRGSMMYVNADMDESREEWFVGAGLSILFGN